MMLGRPAHNLRKTAAALALLGVIVHATLIPWHAAAMFAASLSQTQTQDGLSLTAMCLPGGPTAASDAAAGAKSDPASGGTMDCPICKGLAAFQFAILAATALGLLQPAAFRYEPPPVSIAGAGADVIAPRSRGPPLFT